jgi:hypothetical protein
MWQKYLGNLNKLKKSWKLEYYSKFMKMSFKELNNFSGINSSFKNNHKSIYDFRFKEKQLPSVLE